MNKLQKDGAAHACGHISCEEIPEKIMYGDLEIKTEKSMGIDREGILMIWRHGLVERISAKKATAWMVGGHIDGERVSQYRTKTRAYGMIWAAPKSLSIAWALLEPEQARRMLKEIEKAIGEIISETTHSGCWWVRRGAGGYEIERATPLVAYAVHAAAGDGSPHLHVHLIARSAARCDDGIWRTLDTGSIDFVRRALDARIAYKVAEIAGRYGIECTEVQIGSQTTYTVREHEEIAARLSNRRRLVSAIRKGKGWVAELYAWLEMRRKAGGEALEHAIDICIRRQDDIFKAWRKLIEEAKQEKKQIEKLPAPRRQIFYTTGDIKAAEGRKSGRWELGWQGQRAKRKEIVNKLREKHVDIEHSQAILELVSKLKDIKYAVLEGVPGAGKSSLLDRLCNRMVIATRNAILAKELGERLGSAWTTIHRIEKTIRSQKPETIVIDEGSLVDYSDWKKIIELARENQSSLLILGDRRQIGSIDKMDTFRAICVAAEKERRYIYMSESKRTEKWKEEHRKMRQIIETERIQSQNIKEFWDEVRMRNGVIISQRDHEEAARIAIKTGGVCITGSRSDAALVNLYTQKMLNIKPDETTRVEGGMPVGIGDKVRFLKNRYYGGRLEVANGTLGTVVDINEKSIIIQTKENKIIKIEKDKAEEEIGLGYAMTADSAQGMTFNQVVVLVNEHMNAGRTYVAATRSIEPPIYVATKEEHLMTSLRVSNLEESIYLEQVLRQEGQEGQEETKTAKSIEEAEKFLRDLGFF